MSLIGDALGGLQIYEVTPPPEGNGVIGSDTGLVWVFFGDHAPKKA
jgi:hypothetical protein